MKAYIQVTNHAARRLVERFDINSDEFQKLIGHNQLRSITSNLSNEIHKGEMLSMRLIYIPKSDCFSVLAALSIQDQAGDLSHHVIKTALTVDMYENNYLKKISEIKKSDAVKKAIGEIGFRNWNSEKKIKDHTNRLMVFFNTENKRKIINIKVLSSLCDEFKAKEDRQNILAHPGVLTKVHEELLRFGLRAEDRLYWRFDGIDGKLPIVAKEAHTCPYCGMKPMSTDVAAGEKTGASSSSLASKESHADKGGDLCV